MSMKSCDSWVQPARNEQFLLIRMSNQSLYDEDILLWSEQQAAVIRRLGTTRAVPNDLDIENVAEEIESVGRSELAAVESFIRLILAHLIKLIVESGSDAESHWE